MNRELKLLELTTLAIDAINKVSENTGKVAEALTTKEGTTVAELVRINLDSTVTIREFAQAGKKITNELSAPRYKIVRDKLDPSSNLPDFSNRELNRLLVEKLVEEAKEVLDAYENKTYEDFLEELADLESVLEAVKHQHVVSEAELSEVKYLKSELKGGFRNFVVREIK